MSFLLRWAAPHQSGSSSDSGALPPSADDGDNTKSTLHSMTQEALQVRTLLRRIQTCTVAKDRRDALNELALIEDAGNYMTNEGIQTLLQLLHASSNSSAPTSAVGGLGIPQDNSEIISRIIEILSNVTDEKIVTDAMTRSAFLREIMKNLSLLLPQLGGGSSPSMAGHSSSSFWSKYRVVQLMQRLLEDDTEGLQQQLLLCHGVAALVDLLQDDSNGGVLRNEGLALVSLLTASNAEIQTILSFENGFDSLFAIIRKEIQGSGASELVSSSDASSSSGGGGELIIVVDCLAAVLNMLRNNKATQKYFLEAGSAKMLVPLLTDKLDGLGGGVAGGAPAARSPLLRNPLLGSPAPLTGGKGGSKFSMMANNIVYSAVAIVLTLLRGGDLNGDGGSVRATLAHSGVVGPLAAVALSQAQTLDEGTCAEAANTLAALLLGSKPCCEQLLSAKLMIPTVGLSQSSLFASNPPTQATGASSTVATTSCTAPWVLLWMAVEQRRSPSNVGSSSNSSVNMQQTAFRILVALLSPSSGVALPAASFLAKNLTPVRPLGIGRLQPENHCGFLLSSFLFCATVSSQRSAAALVLNLIIQAPQVQEQLLHVQWPPTTATSGTSPATASGDLPCPPNFFSAYCRSVALVLQQQSTAQSTLIADAATVSCLLRPIVTWLTFCGKTRQLLLSDHVAVKCLVEWPGQTRMSAHAKLICSSVAILLLATHHEQQHDGAAGGNKAAKQQQLATALNCLIDRFNELIGSVKWHEWYSEVAGTPEWQDTSSGVIFAIYDKTTRDAVEEARVNFLPRISVASPTGISSAAPSSAAASTSPVTQPVTIHHQTLSDDEGDERHEHLQPASSEETHPTGAPVAPLTIPPSTASVAAPTVEHHAAIDAEVRRLLSVTSAQQLELASLKKQLQEQQQAHQLVIAALQSELKTKTDEATCLAQELAAVKDELGTAQVEHAAERDAFEDALRRKDEDTQQLASTLAMLEGRLNSSSDAQRKLEEIKSQLEVAVGERDELLIIVAELDEEREVLKNASAIVVTPTNLPTDVDD